MVTRSGCCARFCAVYVQREGLADTPGSHSPPAARTAQESHAQATMKFPVDRGDARDVERSDTSNYLSCSKFVLMLF